MPTNRHTFRRTLKRFADANAYKTADVIPARMVAPVGSYRKVTLSRGCSCSGAALVKSSNPAVTVAPSSPVGVLSVRGGSPSFVIEAAGGRGGPNPAQSETGSSLVGSAAVAFLGIRLASYSAPNATVDIAAFDSQGFYIETLHSGLAITGIHAASESSARTQLTHARSVYGISGLTDGSLAFITTRISTAPEDKYMVHAIDIADGTVYERKAVPTTTPFGSPLWDQALGFDFFNSKLYLILAYDDGIQVDLYEFPGNLGSQSVRFEDTSFSPNALRSLLGNHYVSQFYPNTDVLVRVDPGVSPTFWEQWNKVTIGGGSTSAYVSEETTSSIPQDGMSTAFNYALGLASGKHWLAYHDSTAGFTIGLAYSGDINDVNGNGWTEALAMGEKYVQTAASSRGSGRHRSGDKLVICPIGSAPSGSENTAAVIPTNAASWAAVKFVEIDTAAFVPDGIVPDNRET